MKKYAFAVVLLLICGGLLITAYKKYGFQHRGSAGPFESYASVIRGEVRSDAGYMVDSWLNGTSFATMPAISSAEMTVKRTDGAEFTYELSYVAGSGIYFRPYAHLWRYIHARLGDDVNLDDGNARIREIKRFDTSAWGLPGDKVFQLTFESNVAYLPGARVPEILVPAYNGGWRPANVPPNSVPSMYIYHINENAAGVVAEVSVFYSEGMHLFREEVNFKAPEDGSYSASHCFDFIYEKNNAINANDPVLHYPSNVLLKMWLYDEGKHAAFSFDKLPEKPAQYGVTYEYFINSVNKRGALGYNSWVADRVVIHEYPERLIPERYGSGFGIKDEYAPSEVTLKMTPNKEDGNKINTLRYLLNQF